MLERYREFCDPDISKYVVDNFQMKKIKTTVEFIPGSVIIPSPPKAYIKIEIVDDYKSNGCK